MSNNKFNLIEKVVFTHSREDEDEDEFEVDDVVYDREDFRRDFFSI